MKMIIRLNSYMSILETYAIFLNSYHMEYFRPTIAKLFAGIIFSFIIFSIIQIFVMPLPLYVCPWGPCSHLRYLILFIWFSYFVIGYVMYCCLLGVLHKTKKHLKKRKTRKRKENGK